MSRISCNVTKDLFPSYLDDICSEESRELVEEHLQECPSCKAFLEQLEEQDLGQDTPKVNFLKKTSRFVERRSLLGVIVTMTLLAVILFGKSSGGGGAPLWFLAAEMPILMLLCAYVLVSTKKYTIIKYGIGRMECVMLTLESICVAAAIGLQFLTLYWLHEDSFRPCPLYELGPHLHRSAICITGVAVLLLFILYLKVQEKSIYSIVCQNMVLLVMHLCVSFDDMLHRMEPAESWFRISARSIGILVLEFVLITSVMRYVCHKAENKHSEENTTDFGLR